MPTWDERVFNPQFGNSKSDLVILVLAVICATFSCLCIFYLFYHWSHPIIRAASPHFMLIMLLSSFLLYASVFTWMENILNLPLCHARLWLLDLGFVLFFGTLLIKTWRIDVLFSTKTIEIFQISNVKLSIILSCLLAVHLVFLITNSALPGISLTEHKRDIYRPKFNYLSCTSDSKHKIFTAILAVLNLLFLFWGCYLSWRVRRVPYKHYDESKVIIASIYNFGFFTVWVVVFQLFEVNSDLSALLCQLFTLVGTVFSIAIIFGHKVYLILNPTPLRKGSTKNDSSETQKAEIKEVDWEQNFQALQEKYLRLKDKHQKLKAQTDDFIPETTSSL
eukprot:TRINITY_DN2226_c0_g1_i1.p1 TRINITY_DN2226_c0_g1~~TRINITY_DN2226_c0_g1_i1.p1  ORF type:complete len:335 (+),score=30.26 TRINITY_DN2226_c0_g1_i1:315-1319(+)